MLYLGLKSDVGTFQRYIAKVQLISAHKKLVGQDEAQDTNNNGTVKEETD